MRDIVSSGVLPPAKSASWRMPGLGQSPTKGTTSEAPSQSVLSSSFWIATFCLSSRSMQKAGTGKTRRPTLWSTRCKVSTGAVMLDPHRSRTASTETSSFVSFHTRVRNGTGVLHSISLFEFERTKNLPQKFEVVIRAALPLFGFFAGGFLRPALFAKRAGRDAFELF